MGVVVLGVWGVRTLLVGSYPPDSTAVDLILIFLILMLLMILTVRGLLLMWRRISDLRTELSPSEPTAVVGRQEHEEDEEGLESFSEIA